jgi:chromosome segregation ATPase
MTARNLSQRNQGLGAVGVIGIIVALLVIGGGVIYFTSDVWRTRMDVAYQGFAHWTPENIAKDPVNYLSFCETETKAALEKLEASRISVSQQIGRLGGLKTESQNKVRVGSQNLDQLKTLYKDAAANNAWPIKFANVERDEQWCKRQILSLDGEVKAQQKLLDKLDAGLKQLDVQKTKISDQKSQAQQQISQIQTNREMLKVQQITDDLKNQLVDMKALVSATVDAADDAGAVLSLDQLTTSSETTVDESAFQEILNR